MLSLKFVKNLWKKCQMHGYVYNDETKGYCIYNPITSNFMSIENNFDEKACLMNCNENVQIRNEAEIEPSLISNAGELANFSKLTLIDLSK